MRKLPNNREEILDEISELEVDQHPRLFKDDPAGRTRMAELLLALNLMDEKKAEGGTIQNG